MTSDSPESQQVAHQTGGRHSLPRRAVRVAVVILIAYLIAAYVVLPIRDDPTRVEQAPCPAEGEAAVQEAPDQDSRFRRLAVGTWEDEYQGKRTMTLSEDGTGTMVVELSGLKATLFASRLRFDMTWSVLDGRLKKQTTGGEPAQQVQLILKTMGDRVDERILELTPKRLLLLDRDGQTKYDWRRVETSTAVKDVTTGPPPASRPQSRAE